MLQDDYSNIHITKGMLNLLQRRLIMMSLYERVPATGLRWLLEKIHLLDPRYKPMKQVTSTHTFRIQKVQGLQLPDIDEEL